MQETNANRLEEMVRTHMPMGAVGFFFQAITDANKCIRYPATGCWRLTPFEPPLGVPNGVYQVFFTKALDDATAMPPANARIPYPEVELVFTRQTATHEKKTVEDKSATAAKSESGKDEPRPLSSRAKLHEEFERMPEVRSARAEYLQRQLALDLQENEQDLTKYSLYVREIAELLSAYRRQRQETEGAYETVMALAKRTAEDAQNMMTLFRGMQEMQGQAVLSIKEQIGMLARPPAPPQPPDYTPLGQAAIGLLRDISVALIQLKGQSRGEPPRTLSSGEMVQAEIREKQIEAPRSAGEKWAAEKATTTAEKTQRKEAPPRVESPPPVEVSASPLLGEESPTVPTPEIAPGLALDSPQERERARRVLERLKSMNELEAMLMTSSPERMTAFFESLRGETP